MKRENNVSGRERIGKAFLYYVERKNIKLITVAEICRKARLNRSTFYYYYDNVYDVLNDIVSAISYPMKEFFDEYNKKHHCNFKELSVEEQDEILIHEFWPENLKRIKKNKEIYKIILNYSYLFDFKKENNQIYSYFFEKTMKDMKVKEDKRGMVFWFYFSGELSLIYHWLQNECKDSIEELIEDIYYCEHLTFEHSRR